MKRNGMINSQLAGLCAQLGHTQVVCVADCGLPIPRGVPVVDLALVPGLIGWRDVLDVLLEELVIEAHTVAAECGDSEVERWVDERSEHLGERSVVSHEELKACLPQCAFVVRTGEATPYANILLRCGVPF